ncbi:hypothetical protein NDU88_002470 [Pleurodeles waltl]|uniref:Uncharacterized protein n=1 Tax=Pleurodeles waltl TaxID=8319 RepID=A0AAV7RDW0_PLEWA|nr:hypothetical protein NDU88_002470 [Pleurodeles waltl]
MSPQLQRREVAMNDPAPGAERGLVSMGSGCAGLGGSDDSLGFPGRGQGWSAWACRRMPMKIGAAWRLGGGPAIPREPQSLVDPAGSITMARWQRPGQEERIYRRESWPVTGQKSVEMMAEQVRAA